MWIVMPLLFKNKIKFNLFNQISQYWKCGQVGIVNKVTELDTWYVWWEKWNIYDNRKQSTIANVVLVNVAEKFNWPCSVQPVVGDHLLLDQMHIIEALFSLSWQSSIYLLGAINDYLISMTTSNRVNSCLNLLITYLNLLYVLSSSSSTLPWYKVPTVKLELHCCREKEKCSFCT